MTPRKTRKRAHATPLRRECGTMAAHMLLLETHPSFRARQFRSRRSGLSSSSLEPAVGQGQIQRETSHDASTPAREGRFASWVGFRPNRGAVTK